MSSIIADDKKSVRKDIGEKRTVTKKPRKQIKPSAKPHLLNVRCDLASSLLIFLFFSLLFTCFTPGGAAARQQETHSVRCP